MVALGIDHQALLWALIGATLGLTAAPQASRLRFACVFICAVLASALLGTWFAATMVDAPTRKLATMGSSLILGALFHPLLTAAIGVVPTIVKAAVRRLGLGEQS
jgi:hypothetical protein